MMLLHPATYNDTIATVMASRGQPIGARGRSSEQRPTRSVRVFSGGREVPATPDMEKVADMYSKSQMPKQMALNGSTPEGIKWLLSDLKDG